MPNRKADWVKIPSLSKITLKINASGTLKRAKLAKTLLKAVQWVDFENIAQEFQVCRQTFLTFRPS